MTPCVCCVLRSWASGKVGGPAEKVMVTKERWRLGWGVHVAICRDGCECVCRPLEGVWEWLVSSRTGIWHDPGPKPARALSPGRKLRRWSGAWAGSSHVWKAPLSLRESTQRISFNKGGPEAEKGPVLSWPGLCVWLCGVTLGKSPPLSLWPFLLRALMDHYLGALHSV